MKELYLTPEHARRFSRSLSELLKEFIKQSYVTSVERIRIATEMETFLTNIIRTSAREILSGSAKLKIEISDFLLNTAIPMFEKLLNEFKESEKNDDIYLSALTINNELLRASGTIKH